MNDQSEALLTGLDEALERIFGRQKSKAEQRRQELESDPSLFLDAAIDANAEHDVLCDLMGPLMLADRDERNVELDRTLSRWVDYFVAREEALGRYE